MGRHAAKDVTDKREVLMYLSDAEYAQLIERARKAYMTPGLMATALFRQSVCKPEEVGINTVQNITLEADMKPVIAKLDSMLAEIKEALKSLPVADTALMRLVEPIAPSPAVRHEWPEPVKVPSETADAISNIAPAKLRLAIGMLKRREKPVAIRASTGLTIEQIKKIRETHLA